MPLAKVLRLDDESAAIAEVINGRADAFIYDQLTIVRNYQQYQRQNEGRIY
jgi:polar amino acid transport system substrate-binding protein